MSANWIRRLLGRISDERGSMVVALLAVIVVSGLMISLTATALAGHRATRFDRDHVAVVQGADAGVEDVIHRLNHPDVSQRPALPSLTPVSGPPGTTYSYTITESPVSTAGEADAWQVTSTDTIRGVTRRVSAIVAQPKPFRLVAFADAHMVLRGGNLADSYDGNGTWDTQKGIVGSNGTITLNGSVDADDAELHNWEADPNAARCTSNGNTVCSGYDPHPAKLDVASAEALGFIDDVVNTPTVNCPATPTAFTGTSLAASPTPYCFTTMDITSDFTVTGTGNAYVYLTNPNANAATLSVGNKLNVNCEGCTGTDGAVQPSAERLQIFTKSLGGIRIGNHSHVAASIYAPLATCGGNPSNAGANFYGSMVCAIVTNQGAWSFHYDDRLREVGVGAWTVKRWAEE